MTTPFTRSRLEKLLTLPCTQESLPQTVAQLRDAMVQLINANLVFRDPDKTQDLTDLKAYKERDRMVAGGTLFAISNGSVTQPSADNGYVGVVYAYPCEDIFGNHPAKDAKEFFLLGKADQQYAIPEGARFPYWLSADGLRIIPAGDALDSVTTGEGGDGEDATYQHNGTLVAQQPKLNFVDDGVFTFTVTNDSGSDRVNVSFAVDEEYIENLLVDAIYQENGSTVGQRPKLNFVDTTNTGTDSDAINFSVSDDAGNDRVNVQATLQPFQARWVLFEQFGSSSAGEFTATVDDYWEGTDPGESVTVVDLLGMYQGVSVDGDIGIACLDPENDKYVVVATPLDFLVDWYENSNYVASTLAANFADTDTLEWTVTEDEGNGRVNISAEVIPGPIGFSGLLGSAISPGTGANVTVDEVYGPEGAIDIGSGTEACDNPAGFVAPQGAWALCLRKREGGYSIVNVTCDAVA